MLMSKKKVKDPGLTEGHVQERHRFCAGALLVFALALALTLLVALPVLRNPDTHLFGTEIMGRYHDPFTVMVGFNYPMGLGTHTQPATDFLGAVLDKLFGTVQAYNILVLLTFPLAAFFTYLLSYYLTRSFAASPLTEEVDTPSEDSG